MENNNVPAGKRQEIGWEQLCQIQDANVAKAKSLNIPFSYSGLPPGRTGGMLITTYDGKNDKGQRVEAPEIILLPADTDGSPRNELIRQRSFAHELSEVDHLSRGNALPTHSHNHPLVLVDDAKFYNTLPQAYRDEFRALRINDMQNYIKEPIDSPNAPEYERNVAKHLVDPGSVSPQDILDSYHKSRAYLRSEHYPVYLTGMALGAVDKKYRRLGAYRRSVAQNNVYDKSVRFNVKQELPTLKKLNLAARIQGIKDVLPAGVASGALTGAALNILGKSMSNSKFVTPLSIAGGIGAGTIVAAHKNIRGDLRRKYFVNGVINTYLSDKRDAVEKQANYFAHSTSRDNIENILRDGAIYPLSKVVQNNQDKMVSVEPTKSRKRELMRASDAIDKMKGVKDVDSIFLSRDGYVPSYGEHIIVKNLKHPKFNSRINLVPNEYKTQRPLSLKHNATVYVPDEEVNTLSMKYPNIKMMPLSQIPLKRLGAPDVAKTFMQKLLSTSSMGKIAEDMGIIPSISNTRERLLKMLGPDAIQAGSTGLGLSIDTSDIDLFMPVKSSDQLDKKRADILQHYPCLKDSPYNKNPNRRLLRGVIDGYGVDIALGTGEAAAKYRDTYLNAKNTLTDAQRATIIANKARLKRALLFPEKRYGRYKAKVDKSLGIERY